MIAVSLASQSTSLILSVLLLAVPALAIHARWGPTTTNARFLPSLKNDSLPPLGRALQLHRALLELKALLRRYLLVRVQPVHHVLVAQAEQRACALRRLTALPLGRERTRLVEMAEIGGVEGHGGLRGECRGVFWGFFGGVWLGLQAGSERGLFYEFGTAK